MKTAILTLALILSGCAGTVNYNREFNQGTDDYVAPSSYGYTIAPNPPVEDSWIGAPLDHLLFARGQPTSVEIRSYGENIVDADTNSKLLDVYSWVWGSCRTSFYINNGRVAGWGKTGNCPN